MTGNSLEVNQRPTVLCYFLFYSISMLSFSGKTLNVDVSMKQLQYLNISGCSKFSKLFITFICILDTVVFWLSLSPFKPLIWSHCDTTSEELEESGKYYMTVNGSASFQYRQVLQAIFSLKQNALLFCKSFFGLKNYFLTIFSPNVFRDSHCPNGDFTTTLAI